MKIYAGRPADRLGLILPRWVREDRSQPFRKVLSAEAHAEITRIYGVTIFGWFFGVQRYVARPHTNPDMATTD